jgi:hypothetical protein
MAFSVATNSHRAQMTQHTSHHKLRLNFDLEGTWQSKFGVYGLPNRGTEVG